MADSQAKKSENTKNLIVEFSLKILMESKMEIVKKARCQENRKKITKNFHPHDEKISVIAIFIHRLADFSMDRITEIFNNSKIVSKPEFLLYYGAFAVFVTLLISWVLATLLSLLKPFICAAILLSFARPDLVQNFMQEDYMKMVGAKMKIMCRELLGFLLKLGEQFRSKLN